MQQACQITNGTFLKMTKDENLFGLLIAGGFLTNFQQRD